MFRKVVGFKSFPVTGYGGVIKESRTPAPAWRPAPTTFPLGPNSPATFPKNFKNPETTLRGACRFNY